METLEKVGHLLQSSPAIITCILSQLTSRELLLLSRVCKSWRFYGKEVQRKRNRIQMFMAGKTKRTARNKWIALADMEEVQSLDILTKNALVFGNIPQSRPCLGGSDFTALHAYLPPSSNVHGFMSSQGIIGTNAAGGSVESQAPKNECMSSLLIPGLGERAQILSFALSMEKHEQLFGKKQTTIKPQDITEHFGIPDYLPVKCLVLVVSDYFPVEIGEEVAKAFWEREKGKLALCGGVAENVLTVAPNARETEEPGLLGIAICGEGVRAESIVAPATCKTPAAFKKLMGQLKELFGPTRDGHSLGLIFSCAARGTNIYKKEGVETEIFRQEFPQVPVAGMFSLGEYGWNSFGSEAPESSLMAYSTVAAVISIQ